MIKFFLLAVLIVGISAAPHEHDHHTPDPLEHSQLCHEIEHTDCSTFTTMVVCASNHHTYQNSCEFAKAECKHHHEGLTLEAVHYGECLHHEHGHKA